MSRWIVLWAAAAVLLSSSANAQYIGIFREASATTCAAQVGPAPWVDLHVVAVLEGSVLGVTGVQFRIVGMPETWTPQNLLWVPDPGATASIGNPLFPSGNRTISGVNVAWSTCQEGRVPVGRVVLLGSPTPENVHIRVVVFRLAPEDKDCPLVFLCDAPQFSQACVGGGEFVLNGTSPASCQVAVQENTWTGVKALFR